MTTSTGSVVVAGSDHRSTLAVARALARRHIPLAVVGIDGKSAVASSRYVRDHVLGPSAALEPGAFAEVIRDIARSRGAQLVLPLTDATLAACDLHRSAIEVEARLALPPSAAVWNVLDKRRNLAIARRLGIPCAPQFELDSLDQVPELVERLGFPLVLKNPGQFTEAGRTIPFRWLVARNERELRGYLDEQCSAGAYPLFQALATGVVRNVCCFAAAGELVAVHEYVSVRRWNGEGVLREITPVRPDLRRYAEAMLRELCWEGVAHLGFFVNEVGEVNYMETNGRFWGSINGSVRAGWDFPYWTFRYFTDGMRPDPPALDLGSQTCWHYGDLRALVHFLRSGEPPTTTRHGRTRAFLDYLSGFRPGIGADMFKLDDPLPELVEHWRALRPALRSVGRSLRAG